MHPSGVAKSSTSFGRGKGENVTSAGWQVTLCDPIWHVSSSSGEPLARTAIHDFTFLLLRAKIQGQRSVGSEDRVETDGKTDRQCGRSQIRTESATAKKAVGLYSRQYFESRCEHYLSYGSRVKTNDACVSDKRGRSPPLPLLLLLLRG